MDAMYLWKKYKIILFCSWFHHILYKNQGTLTQQEFTPAWSFTTSLVHTGCCNGDPSNRFFEYHWLRQRCANNWNCSFEFSDIWVFYRITTILRSSTQSPLLWKIEFNVLPVASWVFLNCTKHFTSNTPLAQQQQHTLTFQHRLLPYYVLKNMLYKFSVEIIQKKQMSVCIRITTRCNCVECKIFK